jgi:hypothetical protein
MCPFARGVWDKVKEAFPLHLRQNQMCNARQWIFDFLRRESSTSATVLAVTVWHIWDARNDVRNNEGQANISRVVSKTLAYVEMILKYMCRARETRRATAESVRQRWISLPVGTVCINVNAALFPAERRMGCGIVLRNHEGGFILSMSEGFGGLPAPEMAEAIAVRRGLMVAKDHGVTKAVLVSDYLTFSQDGSLCSGGDHS